MTLVLTLIGSPAARSLPKSLPDALRKGLENSGADCGEVTWLSNAEACDIPFEGASPDLAKTLIDPILAGQELDYLVQPVEGRRKGLLVADMESTIIGQEMVDELAELAGVGEKIAAITARSMAGELDFEASLKERVALLADLPQASLDEVSSRMTLNPGAATLVATLRNGGTYCALVSGGFTHFTEQILECCGFDEARANRLVLAGGKLTGKVEDPVLDRDSKQLALEEIAASHMLDLSQTCAVGDGANDLAMIENAGLGAAYRGKAVLREAADFCIDHGDLTALLFVQGFHRDEFREPV